MELKKWADRLTTKVEVANSFEKEKSDSISPLPEKEKGFVSEAFPTSSK